MTANQIEAARIAINRYIKRGGKIWIRIFPDKPFTKKPAETRMGSGKGAPDGWVAVVKPGRVLFELAGVNEETAREAMRLGIAQTADRNQIHPARRHGGTRARAMRRRGDGRRRHFSEEDATRSRRARRSRDGRIKAERDSRAASQYERRRVACRGFRDASKRSTSSGASTR